MTNPLFDQTTEVVTIDETKDYAAELIGEGKKYKDVSVAARSIIEKDLFIERLKSENAQMRSSLKGETKIDEFLDKLKQFTPAPGGNSQEETPSSTTTQPNNALSLTEVEALLNQREQERLHQQNLSTAAQKAKEAFGANYQLILKQKASELGVTEDYLVQVAKSSPQAFLKLVEAVPQKDTAGVPKSTVTPSGLGSGQSTDRNYAYYEKLRKELPRAKYFSPEIQNQMHRDAQRLGLKDFYS